MTYLIEYLEMVDGNWVLIKQRATTCPQKASAELKNWCDQGKTFWANISEYETL